MAAFRLFFIPLLFSVVVLSGPRCYFPNGKAAESHGPCWDAAGQLTGLCCRINDLCLGNKICGNVTAVHPPYQYRGSCLSQDWSDPREGYPNFCTDPTQNRSSSVDIHQCEEGSTASWYCDEIHTSPDHSPNCFLLPDVPDNLGVYGTAGKEPSPTTSSPISIPILVSTVVSAKSQTTSSTTAPPTSLQPSSETTPTSATPPNTAITTPTATPPGPATTGTASPQDDSKASLAIPIGVGVAVGASVVVAGSLLVFFYLRKRHREAPVRAETPPPFEFSTIDNLNQAPGWLGPAYGPKPEVPGVPGVQRHERGVAEIGGTARFELP